MTFIQPYDSPLGDILLAADETGLTGLWFEGEIAQQLVRQWSITRDHVSCSSSLRFARLTRLICRSKSPLLINSVRTSWSNVGTVQE